MAERKGLKQVEIKGLTQYSRFLSELSPRMDQTNKKYFNLVSRWFFGKKSLLPRKGRATQVWDKHGAWKANMKVMI